MKILMSHPTGNSNVRSTANGFLKAGILAEFDTAIASFPGSSLDYVSKFAPLSAFRRRGFNSELKEITKTFPYKELGRMVALKMGIHALIRHESGIFSIDAVYQNIDHSVSKRVKQKNAKYIDAVYSYEDAAFQTFTQAHKSGKLCFYDLPIGYWRTARKLLSAEIEKWPEWASTLTGFNDSDEKLIRKEEELKLADRIFVASTFTASTLKDFPGTLCPIEVIPYGFPAVNNNKVYSNSFANRPLKLLFIGGLSQRKGIANLFTAVDQVGSRVELTVVGHKPGTSCLALETALSRHRWIPTLPHNEILKLMQAHDVLVFPSLFEGFGLVITEAMSQGTPVITTDRTAGPDLITHGENGWLIEAGSTDALRHIIEELLSDQSIISKAGKAAMEVARKRPWEIYGEELAGAVIKHSQINLC